MEDAMAETVLHQRRQDEAASGVAAKLQAFHDSLTPDEQRALGVALQQIATGAHESGEDAAGHMLTGVQVPLAGVGAAQQAVVAGTVRTLLDVFGISRGR
jgi:hypothetical protein